VISITVPSVTTTQDNCLLVRGVGQIGSASNTLASSIAFIDSIEYQYAPQSQSSISQQILAVELQATAGASNTRTANFTKVSGGVCNGPGLIVAIQIV
jgi:hypothetical protein